MIVLEEVIKALNTRLKEGGVFGRNFGVCERRVNGSEKEWVSYTGSGQSQPITNFDSRQGTSFWVRNGNATSELENGGISACRSIYSYVIPLSLHCVVRKDLCPCDSSYSKDWLAANVIYQLSGKYTQLKKDLHLTMLEVAPKLYSTDESTLPSNYDYACISIDFEIRYKASIENNCFEPCN